jgi:hypothetical protein
VTDDSFYQRHRLDFIHRHRISVPYRRRIAAELWAAALALLIAAVLVRWAVTDAWHPALTAVAAVVVVACVASLRRPAPAPHTHGLRGVPDGPCPSVAPDLSVWVVGNRYAGPVALLTFAVGAPAAIMLPVAAIALALSVPVVVYALLVRHRTKVIARALAAHQPRFAIAYAGYGGGPTHLTMWEAPLLSAGFPGVVFNYRASYCEYLQENTDLTSPFVQLSEDAIRDLQILIVPTLKWFFYLHNARSNLRYMAMRQVKHVWLGHGDSDKPASVFARHADYDILVVSGTAAIERYETAGVHIPREKFAILGRPQVSEILPATRPIREIERPVVLYAPTWQGKRKEVNFSSLRRGPHIVRLLIASGADVIFRPHPLSKRYPPLAKIVHRIEGILHADDDRVDTPGKHVWGDRANLEWSVNECMNNADALVSDVSSVVSDWLQSGKPYAMVSTRWTVEEFRDRFPVARGAYILLRDLDGADVVLADMLGEDSMAAERDALRMSVLGGFSGHESADAFAAYFHDRFAGVST